MTIELTEYVNDEFNRTAVVHKQMDGYLVTLYRGENVVEERACYSKTLQYAEDLAENWINKWGEFKE